MRPNISHCEVSKETYAVKIMICEKILQSWRLQERAGRLKLRVQRKLPYFAVLSRDL
jgi:hypothetical protein